MTEVKILTLFKNLVYSTKQAKASESLTKYQSAVDGKTFEPPKTLLVNPEFCGFAATSGATNATLLETGKYLFVQFTEGQREKAAEALWLEALWLEITVDMTVYERSLEEDGKKVFQLFRKIL